MPLEVCEKCNWNHVLGTVLLLSPLNHCQYAAVEELDLGRVQGKYHKQQCSRP